jgi:uncharacterized protein YbjT (DUF2867 family)
VGEMRLLVLGATGNVGGAVTRAAARAGHRVRAVTRRPVDLGDGVDVHVGDLDDAGSLADACAGVDAVFTLAGYQGLAGTLDAARERGVRRVVLLSSSAAPTGRRDNAVARYHLESEDVVRGSGLEWTLLQPNAFMSNAFRWLPQLRASDVVREPFGEVPLSVVDPSDIAAVALAAMTGDGHHGRTYRLSGPESLTAAERLSVIAGETGRHLSLVVPTDEEARRELSAAMPEPYVDAMFQFYRDGLIDETTVLPTVHEVLGRPPGTFAAWVRANADRFRA